MRTATAPGVSDRDPPKGRFLLEIPYSVLMQRVLSKYHLTVLEAAHIE